MVAKTATEKQRTESSSDESSDDMPDLEEGEVTEAQKKVAEAAGLQDQVQGDKGSKQSRSEKKARKLFSKLGLKPVHGERQLTIDPFIYSQVCPVSAFESRRIFSSSSTNPMSTRSVSSFSIVKMRMSQSPGSDTYIVFGEAKIEDLSQHAQFAAAERLKPTDGPISAPNVRPVTQEEESDGEVDATGIEEKDIELVMSQANVSRNKAVKALKNADNDIVNAIMELTM